MSNVLDNDKQQQLRALGRLGWTLSRIQEATGIRRETVSGYLKAAGIALRSRGRPSEAKAKPAISAEVSTDPGRSKPATRPEVSTDSGLPKPAVSTDPRRPSSPERGAERECLRAVSRADCRGPGSWPERHGDLAGPRRRSRLRRAVRECSPVRRDAARRRTGRGAGRDHDRPRRRRPSRLRRRWADGPRHDHRQVSPRAPLCAHAGLLA